MYTLELADPECTLESSVPFEGGPRVAILASSHTDDATAGYAGILGHDLGKAGATVVAGTAGLAERKALVSAHSFGRAWAIAPDGEIRATLASPADLERAPHAIACALSTVIVVLQSGSHLCSSFSAARTAFEERKHVWVVPPSPWLGDSEGSLLLVRRPGIHVLWRTIDLLASLGLAQADPFVRREDPAEQAIVLALSTPADKDRLARATKLGIAHLTAALFSLMIDGVVRERIDGRYELVL